MEKLMSDNPEIPSVKDGDPGPEDLPPKDAPISEGNVAYETHRRLLREKKLAVEDNVALRQKLEDFQAADKTRQEEALAADKKFQELAELKTKEAADLQVKLTERDVRDAQGRKLSAVLNAITGEVPNKFWGHIELSGVIENPETGEIEATSVSAAVESLQKNFPEIIMGNKALGKTPSGAPLPNGAGTLSPGEWAKMPKKEREAKKNDLQGVPDWMK